MFLMEHFQEGGWGMWPIVVLFVMTVYIWIDRQMYVSKSKVDVDKLMSLLKSQIVSGNIQGAINTCQASPAPVTKIIAAGLLGTITGLIKAFAGVAGVDPSMKATMLSKGISEAMNCTAFGLFTGILGLATFAWLNGLTQSVLDGINQASVETLNLVVAGRTGGGEQQHQQY